MEPFLAEIKMFGGNFAPRGWALCNGQILPIAQNTALFSLLGTTYGGNGQTTFALPDFRGRVPLSQGQGPGLSNYVLGEQTGTESVTITTNQMPAHTHSLAVSNQPGTEGVPAAGSSIAVASDANGDHINIFNTTPPNVALNAASVGYAGANMPLPLVQPVLAVNFIIATEGIFPSRN